MSKFKAGDRVAVYRYGSTVTKGTVKYVYGSLEGLDVCLDNNEEEVGVHPKQCRKLKKKAKKQPHEVWVNVHNYGGSEAMTIHTSEQAARRQSTLFHTGVIEVAVRFVRAKEQK